MRVTLLGAHVCGDKVFGVDDKVICEGENTSAVSIRQSYDPNDDTVMVIDINEQSDIRIVPGKAGLQIEVRRRR